MIEDEFTDEQNSMIASAIAGGQPLCCEAGRTARETICETEEQLAKLDEFAHEGLGCTYITMSREKPGLYDDSPFDRAVETYLRNLVGDYRTSVGVFFARPDL